MFDFIKGQLITSDSLHIVVDNHGVGYKIFIPANTFAKLPQIGENVHLHLSYVVRELSHTLYGFLSFNERQLFEILMGVTGVGPKLALSIIGHLLLSDFQQAITQGNILLICKVPGIGKKTAERLIIELRDKLKDLVPSIQDAACLKDVHSEKLQDAISALIHLGYNQNVAQKALKKTLQNCPDHIDLPTLITLSLKNV